MKIKLPYALTLIAARKQEKVMHTSNYIYHHGEQELHGHLAYNEHHSNRMPAVLVVHDWSGRNAFACEKAESLAARGYVGFAVDMYGEGRIGNTVAEKQALMDPLLHDRRLLRARIRAALDAVITLDEVDEARIAVIGFCFGGLCALDLARSGADIVGAASFHGLLGKPDDLASHPIVAKLLVMHGYDDPMVRPQDVLTFCDDMTAQQVDWQMQLYSHTKHAFMNPEAHDEAIGTVYNKTTARRSWQAMTNFLEEIFARTKK